MSLPPLSSELCVPASSPNKTMEVFPPSLSHPPGSIDTFTKSVVDHFKALENHIKILQIPVAFSPSDTLKRRYTQSLSKKNAILACLADAEEKCQNWEGALRQILGEAEFQKISQAHPVVDVDEVGTVRGEYIEAISHIRMRDFCMSRRRIVPSDVVLVDKSKIIDQECFSPPSLSTMRQENSTSQLFGMTAVDSKSTQ